MQSTYTRDISKELLKEIKEGVFKPFIDFAKEKSDLALCFRGNDRESVTIYRNNHMMWDLSISNGIPEVSISLDHVRFMSDWHSRVIPCFLNMGFVKKNKVTNCLATRLSYNDKGVKKYKYSAVEIVYYPCGEYEKDDEVVKLSYPLLVEMQESYFSTEYEEEYDVYYPKAKITKKEKRPTNYIKKYFFDKNDDAKLVDSNHNMYASFQKCIEKKAQQELFMKNHKMKEGLFIYDMEFVQPKRTGVTIEKANKPDMFGIRYNGDGKAEAICLIEVKSTKTALKDPCGLEKHLEGMEQYVKYQLPDGSRLMDDRKKEAYRILKQYEEINFYGVVMEESEEDFLKLKTEIIFVFTNEIYMDKTNLHKNLKVREYLSKYKNYKFVECGDKCGHADVLIKEYE